MRNRPGREGCGVTARILLASTLLTTGGCYQRSSLDEEGASGTRLRRVLVAAEGTPPVHAGWFDSELDETCTFMAAEDGRTRCIPRALSVFSFEDPGCTTPVVPATSPACGAYRFARERVSPAACGAPASTRVWELERDEVAFATVYERVGGECVAVDRSIERGHRGQLVDPTRFVAIESSELVDFGGPVLAREDRAEDGARWQGGLHDRARDAACTGPTYDLGLDRVPCVPESVAGITRGGSDCDERWAVQAECGPRPELAWELPTDICGAATSVSVLALTDEVPAAEREASSCGGAFGDRVLHRTRPADDAVPWLRRAQRGEGRLLQYVWEDAEGHAAVRTFAYHDQELDVACIPAATVAGVRCVPLAGANATRWVPTLRIQFYADEACTEPAAAADACRSWGVTVDGDCGSIDAVYRAGAPLDRVYRRDESGACVVDDTITAASRLDQVPLESLAVVERRIE